MEQISIILPIHNESEAIMETVERLQNITKKIHNHKFEIIAVNDGSTDNTGSILKKIKNIRTITNHYNLGYGASIKKAMREAKGDWIAITDSDGTYPVENLPELIRYIDEYDMVVGARTGENVHIPSFRRPAKWIISQLANFMTGQKIDDVNSGFRIFNKAKALEFIKLYPPGFSFTTTITLAFITNDYTIKYIPINYYKRKGISSIKPLKDFIGFITLIFRIIMYFRPVKFFLVPACLFIITGLFYGIYQVTHIPEGLGELPLLLLIIGMQTILMGFIADVVSKK